MALGNFALFVVLKLLAHFAPVFFLPVSADLHRLRTATLYDQSCTNLQQLFLRLGTIKEISRDM